MSGRLSFERAREFLEGLDPAEFRREYKGLLQMWRALGAPPA